MKGRAAERGLERGREGEKDRKRQTERGRWGEREKEGERKGEMKVGERKRKSKERGSRDIFHPLVQQLGLGQAEIRSQFSHRAAEAQELEPLSAALPGAAAGSWMGDRAAGTQTGCSDAGCWWLEWQFSPLHLNLACVSDCRISDTV